jgi:hypothetical protein
MEVMNRLAFRPYRGVQPSHFVLVATVTWGPWLPKKTKDVLEMFGEFLREAAVLVPVFFLLEYAIKYDGKLPLQFVLVVLSLSLLLLILGIICEKMR